MRLKVFDKAYALSLELHRMSLKLPQHEQLELARQLRRSSKSICANLKEGFGKRESSKEHLRFLRMAAGSKEETKLWLNYCRDLGYISEAEHAGWYEGHEEVGRMLEGLRKHLTTES